VIQIVIVTNDTDNFSEFAESLSVDSKCRIHWANSVQSALDEELNIPPDLMIIDETVEGLTGIDIARKIILKNAFINLAVASSLPPKIFHEVSEGLGIMAQLPLTPNKSDAQRLLEAMASLR
jgi:two-component SAPR family response regulator